MSLPLWPPAAQRALYEGLGYCQTLAQADGSTWTRPAATERFLFNWQHRYHVVICPARASKSYSAAKKALPLVLGRVPLRDGSGPKPTRGWIVGPTYDLAEKEFRYLWQDLVVEGPKRFGWPKPPISRNSKQGGDFYILTAWGSEIVGKSADKPQSLLGEELDWVLLAEAAQLPGTIWERYLAPRLATTQGYALLPSTPSAGAAWLRDLDVRGQEGSDLIASYRWDVTGNPTYPLAEFEAQKKHLGAQHPAFREQYLGEWMFYEGTVYGHDFDPERNLVDPYVIPPEWPRIRAIDFGYRDPFVCLWAAVTPDGGLDIYREYYQAGRAMADHARMIRDLSEKEPIRYTVADASEQQSIADLRRLGVPALDANRDRRAGRMLVGDYLREGRLRFLRGRCPQTVRELNFYRWDRDRDREGAKEATLGDDHAMDAIRYLVASRPAKPRPAAIVGPSLTVDRVREGLRRERLRNDAWLGVGA